MKNIDKSFQKINDWVASKGFDIVKKLNVGDCVDWNEKIIVVNSKQSLENQLYSLLHECGHVMIGRNYKQFKKYYPMYAYSEDITERTKKTQKYKVSVIAEEIEAWKRGLSLAKRLNIEVNKDNFDKIMAKCVMTYVKWA